MRIPNGREATMRTREPGREKPLHELQVGPGDSSGNASHENNLGAHFKSHGYPPPHPLATEFPAYDMADSIASVEDVVVPVPVRKSTSEIVDGLSRCPR